MYVRTFVQFREGETGRLLDFAYQSGPDFKAVLLDRDGRVCSPDEVGPFKVVDLDEDAVKKSQLLWLYDYDTGRESSLPMDNARMYCWFARYELRQAGYAIEPQASTGDCPESQAEVEAEMPNKELDLNAFHRWVLTIPRINQGKRDGLHWTRSHAKWFKNPSKDCKRKAIIQGMIRLAQLREDGCRACRNRFEMARQASVPPCEWLAMYLLGKLECKDRSHVRKKACEIWDERRHDVDYLHGFADGAIGALFEVAHPKIVRQLPWDIRNRLARH